MVVRHVLNRFFVSLLVYWQISGRTCAQPSTPLGEDRKAALIQELIKKMAGPLPSDSAMIAKFRRSRTCFESILSLAKADVAKGIWRIAPTFLKTTEKILPSEEEQHALLPPNRWDFYRTNFNCAGIDRPNGGVVIGEQAVSFLAEPRGFAGSGLIKMYIWSKKPLGPLRPSLDHLESQRDEAGPVTFIRQFDAKWYLELQMD